jgi:hypothetical protein
LYGRYFKDVKFQNSEYFYLVFRPQYSYLKCHKMCSRLEFASQNSRFLLFLGEICMGDILRMSKSKFGVFFLVLGSRKLSLVTKIAIKFDQ